MAIEQQVADALSDLEAMLNGGISPAEALTLCASEYKLKPEVLESRAQRALGDLTLVRGKNLVRSKVIANEHKADTAINRYLVEKPEPSFREWFEADVGRPPTAVEQKEFTEKHTTFFFKDFRSEI